MQPGAAVFPGDAFIPNSADPSDWGTYGAAQDAPLQVRSLHLWRESVREICKLRLPEPDVGCGARPSKGVVFSGEAPAATPAAPPVEQVVEWTLALSVEPTGKGAVKGFVQQATPPCAHTGPHTARRHTFLHAHTTSIPHKPTYTPALPSPNPALPTRTLPCAPLHRLVKLYFDSRARGRNTISAGACIEAEARCCATKAASTLQALCWESVRG